jgi:hypothetical protein
MIIQLTNSTELLKGKAILINTEMMLSAYRAARLGSYSTNDEVTYIFCPPHGNWEVSETPEEIMALIKGTKNSKSPSTKE